MSWIPCDCGCGKTNPLNAGVYDPENPFNDNARPNSWTPPLNSTWTWGVDRIYGVNLGGWLVLEPFITPDIYQRYPTAVDEWTLSVAMAADTANGGLNQLEQHYDTFIVSLSIVQHDGLELNNPLLRVRKISQRWLVCTAGLYMGITMINMNIIGAGLNFIRVPLAFWAIETWTQDPFDEPFLARTSWK